MNTKLKTLLDNSAKNFTSNKATQNAYYKIFDVIYTQNIIEKLNNEYGFAEINFNTFKAISKRHYKQILIHLYESNLIYTNIDIHKNNTGRVDGKKITRGYKIDRSLIDCEYEVKTENVKDLLVQKPQKHIEVEISDFNVCYYKDCNQFLTKTRTI
jgi:hypothetical protein